MSSMNFGNLGNLIGKGNVPNFGNGGISEEDAQLQELLKLSQNNPDILRKEYEKLLKQSKPMTSAEYLDPKYEMKLDHEGGVVIEPEQSFVLKSKDNRTKEKFFINVVTHPIIDEPEEKNFVDYNNERGIRLPMSLGSLKEDFDKNKALCKVVDCVLNPKIAQTIQKNEEALSFFYQLANNYIQQKYKIELEETFTIPKLKYKGKSVEFQRVKGKKAPKIETLDSEEMPEDSTKSEEALKNSLQSGPSMQPVEWTLSLEFDDGHIEEFDGLNENIDKVQKLLFEFELPLLVTGKNIQLKLSEDEVEMNAGKIYHIVLRPILLIDSSSTQANFDIKKRTLKIAVNKLKKIIKQEESKVAESRKEIINIPELGNDLLFDVV